VLKIKNLRKKYGKRVVLNGINLKLEKGLWALIGVNGAGKTTFLRCIMGVENYDGSIKIKNKEVMDLSAKEIARLIGYVPQVSNQLLPLTVREFIEMGAYYRSGDVEEKINALNIDTDRKITTLSGGEFQKLLIMRALIGNPPILLLDEPASHLDIKNTTETLEIINRYSKENLVILVVHDLNILNFVNGILALKNGKIKILNDIEQRVLEDIFDTKIRIVHNGHFKFILPFYHE